MLCVLLPHTARVLADHRRVCLAPKRFRELRHVLDHAVAAVPLVLEAACLGALCVYGADPVIGGNVVAAAGRVGDVLTHSMLLAPGDSLSSGSVLRAHVDDASGPRLFDEVDYQAVVHQAAGMVSAQCGCGVDDAEDLLRARAFADGQPVERVAQQVLNGERLWR